MRSSVREKPSGCDLRRYLGAREVLGGLASLRIDDELIAPAEGLAPSALRSLDAVHLATAYSLRSPSTLVTYDARLADAARLLQLPVASP
jgi:predicted nucleic acid-binding protein